MNRPLQLDESDRELLWRRLIEVIEDYAENVDRGRVTPELDPQAIRAMLASCDFQQPRDPVAALEFAADGLRRYQTHTPHARYFGLFNPAPATMGIAADALAAAFNPQLAAWSHSPFAIEVERHLIRAIGEKFGYSRKWADGAFASGGAEANHTAVLAALSSAFPQFAAKGVRGLAAQPVFYASAESHHSLLRAGRLCGLGTEALRSIAVDSRLRMIPDALAAQIRRDRDAGFIPFLVAATAGTTNAGAIDPLPEIAAIAETERLWFHVDAAWGGAVALVPEMCPLLTGIERADSITFDAHKWLSVPMGAGIFLTRHPKILGRTFRMETAYMPREALDLDVVDPHLHSIQWSRRFIGLKLFLTLLTAGWEGYASAIRHQTEIGELLKRELIASGWTVENDSPLPVVCFSDPAGGDPYRIAMLVVSAGEAWISTTIISGLKTVLRACITNFRTQAEDIHALIASLEDARRRV